MSGLGTASLLAQRFEADLDRRIGELSRGNRQKIGLIQALFHDPELLMLDEPTTGLDPLMQEEFLAVITEYRDRGGTVFLSSHDLDEVERVCDRVAIIREGRLAAVEKVAELRGRSYHHVSIEFDSPVDGHGVPPHPRRQPASSRRLARLVQGLGPAGSGRQGRRSPHRPRHGADRADARRGLSHLLRTAGRTHERRTPSPHPQSLHHGRRSAPDWQASLRAMIRRGLLDRRRAILTWGLSLGALSAFMAAIYPFDPQLDRPDRQELSGRAQGGVRRPGDEHRGGLHPRRDVQPDRAARDGLLRDPRRCRRHRRRRGARPPRHDPRASRIADHPDGCEVTSSLRWFARRSWQ